jgi:putative oxidoreductase
MKKVLLREMFCALIILLLIYTGVAKYINLNAFTFDMHNQPFPRWFSDVLVAVLPPLEIAAAILLCFPKTRLAGLYVSLSLFIAFTVYSLLVLFAFFPRVPCSCGGIIKLLSWRQHLAFTAFFTALNIICIRWHKLAIPDRAAQTTIG